MLTTKSVWLRFAVLLLFQSLCWAGAQAQTPDKGRFAEEFSKQDNIYRDKVQEFVEGYVTDRALEDYAAALPSDFDRALANLGPEDRWLDIGAGRGQAILDYYSLRYDMKHAERHGKKARAVAMSIEDRRTVFWDQTVARLDPNQLQYVFNKRLRDYTVEELGRFQVITDVIGGFSYTSDLSLFMEKVLGLLALDGSFYTLLQDARSEDGTNTPYYKDAPFLTVVNDASGADIGVCAWLKKISCVEVTCESKGGWKPPLQVYQVHKVCEAVSVPPLETQHFAAGTPPERRFRLLTPPSAVNRIEATR